VMRTSSRQPPGTSAVAKCSLPMRLPAHSLLSRQ
jgi:hypothetical protein